MLRRSFTLGVDRLPASSCSLTLPAKKDLKKNQIVKFTLHLITHLPSNPLCHNDGKVFSLSLLPSEMINVRYWLPTKRFENREFIHLRNCVIRFFLLSFWSGVNESQEKIPRSYLRNYVFKFFIKFWLNLPQNLMNNMYNCFSGKNSPRMTKILSEVSS